MGQDLVPTDLRLLTAIICQGRNLVDGKSVGDVCGATIRVGPRINGSLLDAARAQGWRIGHRADGTPDAMCARCAKPDPTTAALCRDLERSISP